MDRRISLSFRYLIALYLIIPLSLTVVAADIGVWEGSLKRSLPFSPEEMRWFTVFFHLPHIVTSLLIFFDREYLSFYKVKLLTGLPLIGAGTLALALLLGNDYLFAAMLLTTSYHVLMQQIGITRGLVKINDRDFLFWKGSFLFIGTVVSLFMFFPQSPLMMAWKPLADSLTATLFLPATYCAYRISRKSDSLRGVRYLWANHLMLASLFVFYGLGYPFFVILVMRVIHDLTAFGYYTVHNHNRNLSQPRNLIFGTLGFSRTPVLLLLTPLVGMAVAYPLWEIRDMSRWVGLGITMIVFFHYFTEGFSWKGGTPHRASIRLS